MLLLRGAYQSSAAWPPANGRATRCPTAARGAGKTLGLIGFGSIGQLTASPGARPGHEVIAFDAMMDADHPAFADVGVRCAGLDEVIRSADVVSLHVPLVDSTRGLFDAARIASMKPGAVLINTARGGIVDEVAWPRR
jgi:(S)-sulfolactate dehydrogenase